MKTLLILAHQDDEVISTGVLIQRRLERGAVRLLTLFGRKYNYGYGDQHEAGQLQDFHRACDRLSKPYFLERHAALLEEGEPGKVGYYAVLHVIENALADFRPTEVVTHSPHDLNQDHRHLSACVDIALRPANLGKVRRLLHCVGHEGSSQHRTDYYVRHGEKEMKVLLNALACYGMESRQSPHARSPEMLRAAHMLAGSRCDSEMAEAYEVRFQID